MTEHVSTRNILQYRTSISFTIDISWHEPSFDIFSSSTLLAHMARGNRLKVRKRKDQVYGNNNSISSEHKRHVDRPEQQAIRRPRKQHKTRSDSATHHQQFLLCLRNRQRQEHKNAARRLLKIFYGVIFTKLFLAFIARFVLAFLNFIVRGCLLPLQPPTSFFLLHRRQLSWDD